MAVLPRIADPHLSPFGEADASGPLDLQEEGVDRIVHPDQLQTAPGQRALLDRLAVGERDQRAVLYPAGDPAPFEVLAEGAEIDAHQLRRPAVERDVVALGLLPAALEEGLVIPGEESLSSIASLRMGGQRTEPALETGPGRQVVAGRYFLHRRAGGLPVAGRAREAGPSHGSVGRQRGQ